MDRATPDASVFVDAFAGRERKQLSLDFLEYMERESVLVIEPALFLVEVSGVLIRFLPRKTVRNIVDLASKSFIFVHDTYILQSALRIALKFGTRAADAYYIAVSKEFNTTLVTSDRIQYMVAQEAGADAVFLPGAST